MKNFTVKDSSDDSDEIQLDSPVNLKITKKNSVDTPLLKGYLSHS